MIHIPSKTTPRPYQQRLYDKFADNNEVMWAVGMGGGKSKIIVDMHNYKNVKRGLIVCPSKVMHVWEEEFAIHSANPYKVFLVQGTINEKLEVIREAWAHGFGAIVVISYDSVWREPFSSLLIKFGFCAVTLDESHNIKNAQSKRSRYCVRMGKQALFKWCCSGTAMADRHTDIFGQYKFLDESIFGGSFVRFRDRYCKMGGFQGRQVLGPKNQEELTEKLAPLWAFVPQEEIDADLPSLTTIKRSCFIGAKAKTMYKKILKEQFLERADGKVLVAENSLERALRLRELTSGYIKWTDPDDPKDYDIEVVDTAKRDLLEAIISDIPNDEPLVIFAVSRFDIETIHTVCNDAGRTTSELSGKFNQLEDWKNGSTNTLVAQIRSGGTGIELTRACYNIYYSINYSLADFQQSQKRSHRTKQNRPVIQVHLLAHGTIDQTVMQAIEDKRDIVDAIKEALELNAHT